MVEAMAMREGSSLANTMGCNQIIAESDAMEIIEACTGEQVLWSDSSAIFAGCVDMVHLIWDGRLQTSSKESESASG
jgi:hypothetical protein